MNCVDYLYSSVIQSPSELNDIEMPLEGFSGAFGFYGSIGPPFN